jgi:hypothetical protein
MVAVVCSWRHPPVRNNCTLRPQRPLGLFASEFLSATAISTWPWVEITSFACKALQQCPGCVDCLCDALHRDLAFEVSKLPSLRQKCVYPIPPQYYVDSVLNSDGLSNEPSRTHWRNLQTALSSIAPALLSNPAQVHQQTNLSYCEASDCAAWTTTGKQYCFQYGAWGASESATFLENVGADGIVSLHGRNYSMFQSSMQVNLTESCGVNQHQGFDYADYATNTC